MMVPVDAAVLTDPADVEQLAKSLQDQLASGESVAVALLQFSAQEPHPRVRAALLHTAAKLVLSGDPERATDLYRESFRLFPSVDVGRSLAALTADAPVFARLFRHGHLVDATAVLAAEGPAWADTLLDAARSHVNQGHGRAAVAVLDRLLAGRPNLSLARELMETATAQVEARQEGLTAQRLALAECDPGDRAESLVAYAELLLAGDEALDDAAAVLADAVDSGADLASVAPLWVEVARAQGNNGELTKALACSLDAGSGLPKRLQHADELVNIPSVDRVAPRAALAALRVLSEAMPDDAPIAARLDAVTRLAGPEPEAQLEDMRMRTVRERDRLGETVACLGLASLALAKQDWPMAERHYRRVRTLSPQDAEALDFFEQLYRQSGDHKRLLVALSQRLGATEGRETVRIALEMARLCEGPLESPDRALEAYQRILTVQPDHEGALNALETLNTKLQRWPAVREALERNARAQLAKVAVDPRTKDAAIATLTKLVDLCQDPQRCDDPAATVPFARQIIDLAPDHDQALAIVSQHLNDQGRYAELVQLLRRAAGFTNNTNSSILLRLGNVLADELGQPAAAMDAWRAALDAHPGLIEAQLRLRRAARDTGDSGAVLASLLDEIGSIVGAAAIDLATPVPTILAKMPAIAAVDAQTAPVQLPAQLLEAAVLAEARSDGSRLAGRLYALILTDDPNHDGAVAGLVRCWSSGDDGAQLIQVLQRLVRDETVVSRKVQLLANLAGTQLNVGFDFAGAGATASAALQLAPDHQQAREIWIDAALALGDMIALRQACGNDAAGLEMFAARAGALAAESSKVQRFAQWRAAAAVLHDDLGDAERAALMLSDAVQACLAAASEPVTTATQELLSSEERTELCDLARKYAHAAGLRGAERLALEAMLEVTEGAAQRQAKLALVDLMAVSGETDDAEAMARSLAEEAIGDRDTTMLAASLDRLCDLAAAGIATSPESTWESVADLLALAADDGELRTSMRESLLSRCLANAERLSQSEEFWACVDRLAGAGLVCCTTADDNSTRQRLLELQEQACIELGNWGNAAAAAEALAGVSTGEAASGALLRAAELAFDRLADSARAERLYRLALAANPTDGSAWAGLAATVRASGDSTAMGLVLDEIFAVPSIGRDSRARFALERAELAATLDEADLLGLLWPVVSTFADWDSLAESEEAVLAIAAGQLDVPELGSIVAERLRPIFAKHGRIEEEVRCREIIALHAPRQSAARITGLIAVAESVADSSPRQAFDALFHAVADAPERADLLEKLTSLADRIGGRDRLQKLLRGMAGLDVSGEYVALPEANRHAALARLAQSAQDRGDVPAAIEALVAWRTLQPENLAPLVALQACWQATGDTENLAEVLQAQTTLGPDASRAAAWLGQIALTLTISADVSAALALATAATSAVGARPELWLRRIELARELNQPLSLATAIAQTLTVLPGALTDRFAAVRELAIALQNSGPEHATAAIERWLEILDNDPADDAAIASCFDLLPALTTDGKADVRGLLDRLELIADARGEGERVDQLLTVRADVAVDAADRTAILLRQAQARENTLGDADGAAQVLALAARLAPQLDAVLPALTATCRLALAAGSAAATISACLESAAAARDLVADRLALRRLGLSLIADSSGLEALRNLLEGVLRDDPDDESAAGRLDALATVSGDVKARLALLSLRIARAADADTAGQLWIERAQLATNAGLTDDAKASYRACASAANADIRTAANAGLAEVCENSNDPAGAAAAVAALLTDTADLEDRIALTLRAVGLWQTSGAVTAAQEALRSVLTEAPRNLALHTALEASLADSGNSKALVEHLANGWNRLDSLEEGEREAMAQRWLAAVQSSAGSGDELTAACKSLTEQGLAIAAVDETLESLTQAEFAGEKWPAWLLQSWQIIADRAQHSGATEGELAARLQLGAMAVDRSVQLAAIRRSAVLLEAIGEPDAALAKWYELLDLGQATLPAWTDDDAIEILRLGDVLERNSEAAEYVQIAAAELADPDRKIKLLLLLAGRAQSAGDAEQQWALAQQILVDAPLHSAALAVRGAALQAWSAAPTAARVSHAQAMVATAHDDPAKAAALVALGALLLAETATAKLGAEQLVAAVKLDHAQNQAAFELVADNADVAEQTNEIARLAAGRSVAAAAWLEGRARALSDWSDLDSLIEARARAAATDDVDAAVAAWLELADLRSAERDDAKAAAAALDAARALAPSNDTVLRLRLQLAETAQDHSVVGDLCQTLAGSADADEAGLLWYRGAQAYADASDTDKALLCCVAALQADTSQVDVHLLQARIRSSNGQQIEAIGDLDSAARAMADAGAADGAAALWLAAVPLARESGDAESWGRVLAAAIRSGVATAQTAQLAKEAELEGIWLKRGVTDVAPALFAAGLHAEALALRKKLAQTATGVDRLTAQRGLAQQTAEDGDPASAVAALFEVAISAELPAMELPDVLGEAQAIALAAGMVEDWLDRVAEIIASDVIAQDQLSAVVGFAAQVAADADLADRGADLWDQLWEQLPDDVDARDGTLALRRLANDPGRLAAALEKALVFAEASAKTGLRIELAALKLDSLGRPREALRLVQDVLGVEPNNEDATALAERLADNAVLGDETLTFLDRHLRTAENWLGLERVLTKRVARAKTAAAKSELAQMLAQLQSEQLSHADSALGSLWAAIQAEPRLTTLESIERLARPVDHDDLLARAYGLVLASPLRPDDRSQVLLRAALLDKRRGDLAAAERRLRNALSAAPQLSAAFDLLDGLLDEQGRAPDQLVLLADRANKVSDPAEKLTLLNRTAELARALQDADAAIDAYARLADLDATDVDSRAAIVELLREAGPSVRLPIALVALAEVTETGVQKAELLCEAARLQPAGASGEEKAAELYRAAFAGDGSSDEAYVWLERHCHHNPRMLAPLYQARADGLPLGPTRTLTLRKLAHAHRDMNDGAQACTALQRAHAEDPLNAAVLDELQKTSESLRNWDSWVAATEHKLAAETRKEARAVLLVQLVRVLLVELEDATRAQALVAELQKIAPKDPNTRQVVAMLKSHSGDPAEAAAGLEQVLRETDDPAALLAIHQQLADLYLGVLNNPGKGIRELQRMLVLDPKRWEFRRTLCDLYAQRQSYEALAESLKQWLAQFEESAEDKRTLHLARGMEIAGLMRELADVLVTLGKPQEATQMLRRAWELSGNEAELNAKLAPLLEMTGEVQLAAELHDWLAAHFATDKAKVATHLSKSALLHERRGDFAGARERFKKAMESAPGDDEATLGSARVCLELNEPDRAMRLFDLVARKPAHTVGADLRADANFGMGRCRLKRNQRDQARACFEQALALVPGHKAAAEALLGLA
ncbi:MAG: tetratricopeptide repeat protein [Myxococcales bacterium]|nr:tetratricopeptide repeat protein [Myxococcales bacterium]